MEILIVWIVTYEISQVFYFYARFILLMKIIVHANVLNVIMIWKLVNGDVKNVLIVA